MPSLLDPDQTTPDAGAGLLGIGRPQITPPDPGVISQADALAQTYQAITAEIARQQQISADRGLWTGGGLLEGGHPTGEGVTDAAQQVAQSLLLGTSAPGGKPSFTAYHGSPHSFDAFDTAAIGTGEGAQAYGHGLYFADKEGVARGYRDALSQRKLPDLSGYDVPPDTAERVANGWFDYLKNAAPADHAAMAEYLRKDSAPESQMGADILEGKLKAGTGHMYEVNINAPPEHFLDWDKPLSEQHPVVQERLRASGVVPDPTEINTAGHFGYSLNEFKNLTPEYQRELMAKLPENHLNYAGDPRGSELYEDSMRWPSQHRDPVAVAQALRDAGIPGIRYLDAGSRGGGEGTRNTVIFDPATIEILRKYGIAGLMAGGAGAAATQKPSQ